MNRDRRRPLPTLPLLLLSALSCAAEDRTYVAPSSAPYAPSPVIVGITFDWSTHERRAPGSDNWPLTWAGDGHQYTSWGDGGGFGGTNDDFRVSLGFGRVDGEFGVHTARNVWGHPGNSENEARFGGKTRTILAVGETLYFWRSPGSDVSGVDYQRLYRSDDHGARWRDTGVEWTFDDHGIGLFAMLQAGRGHAGERYVHIYATELHERIWEVQVPGEIVLLRVPTDSLEHQAAYRFFAGLDSAGEPTWGTHGQRVPVHRDARGLMRNSAIHNPALDRYLLVTNHTARNQGNVGIFEAPTPWGPWSTVMYETGWPRDGEVPRNTFFANFSPRWSWGEGGRDFVLVFTGKQENDAWNAVRGSLILPDEASEGSRPRAY